MRKPVQASSPTFRDIIEEGEPLLSKVHSGNKTDDAGRGQF